MDPGGGGVPCEEGKAFVVVPRFVLDEIFGLMAVFFFLNVFFRWRVCLGGPAGGGTRPF
jgi:hypothetical protein